MDSAGMLRVLAGLLHVLFGIFRMLADVLCIPEAAPPRHLALLLGSPAAGCMAASGRTWTACCRHWA